MNQQQRIDSLNAAVKANCPARPEKACDKVCDNAAPCQGNCQNCQNGNCQNCQNCQDGECQKGEGKCKKNKEGEKTIGCDKAKGCDKAPQQCNRAEGAPRMGKCPYGDEYIAKVKEILTPDQYTMFLENIVSMPQGPQKGGKMGPKQNKMKARDCNATNCPKKENK